MGLGSPSSSHDTARGAAPDQERPRPFMQRDAAESVRVAAGAPLLSFDTLDSEHALDCELLSLFLRLWFFTKHIFNSEA